MSDLKFAVLLPQVLNPRIRGGGHLNAVRLAGLLGERAEARLVSYAEREDGVWYLPDVEARLEAERYVLLLTWGPDVMGHVERFRGRMRVAYYQQSINQGIELPPDVPVICNSKYLMTYAQEHWPATPQFYLPPVLEPYTTNLGLERDIDVLVVRRKMPAYVSEQLIPLLEGRCRVHVQTEFVGRDELIRLFNRAKVYLYAFAPQRTKLSATGWRMMEGFGAQSLEAMVCGCTVFSNLRGGMADWVDPYVHGYRLESHSPEWDARQILKAVETYPQENQAEYVSLLAAHYGEEGFRRRAARLLEFLSDFYEFAERHPARPEAFGIPRPVGLKSKLREDIVGTLYRQKRRLAKAVAGKGRDAA